MRWFICLAGLLIASVLCLPATGQDQKKPGKAGEEKKNAVQDKKANPVEDLLGKAQKDAGKQAKDDKKSDKQSKKSNPLDQLLGEAAKDKKVSKQAKSYGKLRVAGSFVGTLRAISANNELTISVEYPEQVPNPDYGRQFADWQRDISRRQFDIARQGDFIQRQRQLEDLARRLQERPIPYQIQKKNKDVMVRTGPDFKVRIPIQLVPPQFDEKGKRVPLTKEMLAKLKGDPTLPHFEASMSDLREGQIVQVYLAVPPAMRPKQPPQSAADIIGTSPPDQEIEQSPYPEAAIVVIMQPPNS